MKGYADEVRTTEGTLVVYEALSTPSTKYSVRPGVQTIVYCANLAKKKLKELAIKQTYVVEGSGGIEAIRNC